MIELPVSEIRRLTWVPNYDPATKVIKKFTHNRYGAPVGLAHEPYAVLHQVDRKGRPYQVILTRPVDLKAMSRAAKKAKRERGAQPLRMAA